jgi:hypothetical protein
MSITFGDCSCNVAVPDHLFYQAWRDICGITMCDADRGWFVPVFDLADVCGACFTHYLHAHYIYTREQTVCPDPPFWGMGSSQQHRSVDYNRWDAEVPPADTGWIVDYDTLADWPPGVILADRFTITQKSTTRYVVYDEYGCGTFADPYNLDVATWLMKDTWDIELSVPLTLAEVYAELIALYDAVTFDAMRALGALGIYDRRGAYNSAGGMVFSNIAHTAPNWVSSYIDVGFGGGGYVGNAALTAMKSILKIGPGTVFTSPDLCVVDDDYWTCSPTNNITKLNYDPSGLNAVTQRRGTWGYKYLLDGVCTP